MNATLKALQMIGMTENDMERRDFFKASGRKAAVALRSMGYTQERFKTMVSGGYATRWAKDGCPITVDYCPAFNVLCMAIGHAQRTNG